MVNNDEIVVLILSTKDVRYDKFKTAIENSWMRKMSKLKVKCFFYEGAAENDEIIDNTIFLKEKDDLLSTSKKLIKAFEMILSNYPETKLIYRTNLSSYIEVENFLKFILINDLNSTSYLGVIGKTNYVKEYFNDNRFLSLIFSYISFGPKINFASGSGFFIGIDNVKLVCNKKRFLNFIDDVMVGVNLNIQLISSIQPHRFDIRRDFSHRIDLVNFNKLQEESCLFHYRFKTADREFDSMMLYNFNDSNFRREACISI